MGGVRKGDCCVLRALERALCAERKRSPDNVGAGARFLVRAGVYHSNFSGLVSERMAVEAWSTYRSRSGVVSI